VSEIHQWGNVLLCVGRHLVSNEVYATIAIDESSKVTIKKKRE